MLREAELAIQETKNLMKMRKEKLMREHAIDNNRESVDIQAKWNW